MCPVLYRIDLKDICHAVFSFEGPATRRADIGAKVPCRTLCDQVQSPLLPHLGLHKAWLGFRKLWLLLGRCNSYRIVCSCHEGVKVVIKM